MNDLPNPPNLKADDAISAPEKEKEAVGAGPVEAPVLKEVGRGAELPTEVASAGVHVQPTTVPIPPSVQQLGVKQVGGVSPTPPPAIALPLSDNQIVQGLHEGVTSSWRWLAEWCKKKLKQLHTALKTIHGKLVRVPTR